MIDHILEAMQRLANQDKTMNNPEHDQKNDQEYKPVNEQKIVKSTLKISQVYQPFKIVGESLFEYFDVLQWMNATITYADLIRYYPMIEIDKLEGRINCYEDPKGEPVDVIVLWQTEATIVNVVE